MNLPWVILGAGRVGRALLCLAASQGQRVSATWNRSERARARTLEFIEGDQTLALSGPLDAPEGALREVLREPSIVWLTVSDEAIAPVAAQLAALIPPQSVALHTCGSVSSEVLRVAGVRAACASLHPLLSVAEPHAASQAMSRCAWTLEGEPRGVEAARAIARDLIGVTPHEIAPQAKALYHASAVSAAGLLVSLMDASFEMARAAGIEDAEAMLLPLAQSCLDNLAVMPPERALTGPAARGDTKTIAAHREAIARARPELLELYDALNAHAARLRARGVQRGLRGEEPA